ncbi:phospholipase D alpha 4 [Nymphaea colorata]|nr:phospholipase D alpha 4 [Nymphaea colorata]
MGTPTELLHGTLHAFIFDATSPSSFSICSCIFEDQLEPARVTIKLDRAKVAETSHDAAREWNVCFHILCAQRAAFIRISLKTKSRTLGRLIIPVSEITTGTPISGLFPLQTERGKTIPKLKLRFSLHFKYPYRNPLKEPKFPALSLTTFPQRSNCNLRLYQDAHTSHDFPSTYKVGRNLWEDVYKAIDEARLLIYITGWSLNPKTVLVRDLKTSIPDAIGVSIGELLKRKAQKGVAVRVMLWNDETSLAVLRNSGVMHTHDEEAYSFFQGTEVVCRLCTRDHAEAPALFAHHQKTITVDAGASSGGRREIVSFVGGLDLCDGRYDDQHHYLFKTLDSIEHVDDFYQSCIADAKLQKGGPREPWHDVHARVTGPAAWDILANFEQRWSKQCDSSLLLDKGSLSNQLPTLDEGTSSRTGDWKVQVFRSIDRASVSFLPENLHAECSIHEAYVQAIRHAERFIYVENQYFMGGCHLWESDTDCGCKNLIPVEIALKIASKIRNKERFGAYIVVPLWPEGHPEGEVVQEILHWSRLTMEMMYKIIGQAIMDAGSEGLHPKDYLNFFCLANRELEGEGENYIPPSSPSPFSDYWNSQKNRRFMIYVHSKLMIVDDEYVLIGSANVNQRSMDFQRDTEIVIGCHQPKHIGHGKNYGGVHEFRMSLWWEHTKRTEEEFVEPHSLECVRKMREIGDRMWSIFSGEAMEDMGGVHLVSYPITVSEDGRVEDDGRTFPDTTAHVRGRRTFLPPILTT